MPITAPDCTRRRVRTGVGESAGSGCAPASLPARRVRAAPARAWSGRRRWRDRALEAGAITRKLARARQDDARLDAKAAEGDATRAAADADVRFEFEPPVGGEVGLQSVQHLSGLLALVAPPQHIVHVAHVGAHGGVRQQPAIGAIQISVGEMLRGKRADRQTARGRYAVGRCARRGIDDAPEQGEKAGALEAARQQGLEQGVIDAGEVTRHIHLHPPAIALQMALHLRHGGMYAKAGPAGEAGCHQRAFELRLGQVEDGVMQHAIGKAGGGDDAALGIADGELAHPALRRLPIPDGRRQAREARFQLRQPACHAGTALLAARGLGHCQQQVVARGDLLQGDCQPLHSPTAPTS